MNLGHGAQAWIFVLAASLAACGGEPTSETSPDPDAGATCAAASAEGILVSATDPYGGAPYALGYLPYAIDACALAYVSDSGDLRLRDLAGGGDRLLEGAANAPRRPAVAGDLVAWEATIGGADVVRVRDAKGTLTIEGAFHHAREPRVAADAVVFTAWLSGDDAGDTDVLLYTPSTGALATVAGGPGQQRFADVSATHVAWTDFTGDSDGAFSDDAGDAPDVVVLERATGKASPRAREGKQAFPDLGAPGKIAYLDWGLVHPEPKFTEYDVRLGTLGGDGADDVVAAHIITHVLYVRPAARGATLAWVTTADLGGDPALVQRAVDLGSLPQTVGVFPGQTVFGPAAASGLVLVGASPAAGAVTLRAFSH